MPQRRLQSSRDPIFNQVKDWQTKGLALSDEMEAYEWEYRKKICSKCSVKQQKILKCFRVNNFVDGIQETHCEKMIGARTQKFSKKIDAFFYLCPLRK